MLLYFVSSSVTPYIQIGLLQTDDRRITPTREQKPVDYGTIR